MSDSRFDCETATAPEMAKAVVEYIEEHGWTRGSLSTANGAVCLVGALGGICAGDPQQGYGVIGGYRHDPARPVINSTLPVPAGVLAFVTALAAEGVPVRTFHVAGRQLVTSGNLTTFNDMQPNVDRFLAPFRKIAQGEVKVDD